MGVETEDTYIMYSEAVASQFKNGVATQRIECNAFDDLKSFGKSHTDSWVQWIFYSQ